MSFGNTWGGSTIVLNGFEVKEMVQYLNKWCKTEREECTKFPGKLMELCEKKKFCSERISEAVNRHCEDNEKSPVCEWLTTTEAPSTVKITTTAKSATPFIVGGVIGGLVMLVAVVAIYFFCRRNSTPDAQANVEANDAGNEKKKKGDKTTGTTEISGTTTSVTKKDKKKKKGTVVSATKTASTGI